LVELRGQVVLTVTALVIVVLNLLLVGLLALFGWLGWTSFLLLSGAGWLLLGGMLEFGAQAINANDDLNLPDPDDPFPLNKPRLLLPAWLLGWIMLTALIVRVWGWWGALAVLILTGWGFVIRGYLVGSFRRPQHEALAQARAAVRDLGQLAPSKLPPLLQRAWISTLLDQYSTAAAAHNIEVLRLALDHLAPLLSDEEVELMRFGIGRLRHHERIGTVMIAAMDFSQIKPLLGELEQRQLEQRQREDR
jgi:hypothetical protein